MIFLFCYYQMGDSPTSDVSEMSLSYYSILSSVMRFKAVTKYIQNRYIFYSFPVAMMRVGHKNAAALQYCKATALPR